MGNHTHNRREEILPNYIRSFLYFTLGLLTIPIFIAYLLVTIPAIFYQAFVTKILMKSGLRPRGIKKLVSPSFGTAYAAEYVASISCNPPRSSRNAIVNQSFVSGIVPAEECVQMIKTRLLEAKKDPDGKSDTLKYPEFKYYVTNWMGYLFWKEDPHFRLEDHVGFHSLPPSTNLQDFAKEFIIEWINKPFVPKRSPWDMRIVYSCNCVRNQSVKNIASSQCDPDAEYTPTFCSTCGKEEMTLFTTRIHHCMGDGLSFMLCLHVGLFGGQNFDLQGVQDQKNKIKSKREGVSHYGKFVTLLKMAIELCHDVGCVASFSFWRANDKTAMHVTDDKKTWRQLCRSSENFPLQRMKSIKNHFGVNFSTLVASCISAGVAKHLKVASGAEMKTEVKNFLMAMVMPLPSHPLDGWINGITGAAYKLPMNSDMDPVDRLLTCDKVMKQVNRSLFTQWLFPWLTRLLTFHVTPIVQFGFFNRSFGGGISNFSVPGNSMQPVFKKYKLLDCTAAAGGNDGINGALFGTLGYNQKFQFISIVEKAVMGRKELQAMVEDMKNEVDMLYDIILSESSKGIELQGNGKVIESEYSVAEQLTPVQVASRAKVDFVTAQKRRA